jgi:hypothetical protein
VAYQLLAYQVEDDMTELVTQYKYCVLVFEGDT